MRRADWLLGMLLVRYQRIGGATGDTGDGKRVKLLTAMYGLNAPYGRAKVGLAAAGVRS